MIVRVLLFLLLVYLLYKIFKSFRQLKVKTSGNDYDKYKTNLKEGEDLVEDPFCHTYVPISQAFKKEISGRNYYFCSRQCSDKFEIEKNK